MSQQSRRQVPGHAREEEEEETSEKQTTKEKRVKIRDLGTNAWLGLG